MDFGPIWEKAKAAGDAAHASATCVPMAVYDADVLTGAPTPGGNRYVVADGMCGFAGVVVKGNSAFGRWAKKRGLTHNHYPSGLYISTNGMSQSITRAEAAAHAIVAVLRDAGIDCHSDSRLD
jgi:hypothetical protein